MANPALVETYGSPSSVQRRHDAVEAAALIQALSLLRVCSDVDEFSRLPNVTRGEQEMIFMTTTHWVRFEIDWQHSTTQQILITKIAAVAKAPAS